MNEIERATRHLEDALEALRSGREGASPAWVRAAEDYVEHCRDELRRLREGPADDPGAQAPESFEPFSSFFPRSGQRSN